MESSREQSVEEVEHPKSTTSSEGRTAEEETCRSEVDAKSPAPVAPVKRAFEIRRRKIELARKRLEIEMLELELEEEQLSELGVGAIEQWLIFIANYEQSTAVCGFSDEENLLRLQKALRGPALDSVGHLLYFLATLSKAIAILRSEYGRPDLIVDGLINKDYDCNVTLLQELRHR
uniref:Uncharacterized protein n=1 Tax=Anopheles dirus TaxID=7168 RepID=A0A182NQ52_9DIPT